MKRFTELRETPRLTIKDIAPDGGRGIVRMLKWEGTVIWSNGLGWDHVSVSPYKKHIVPSWEDMCMLKDMFFNDEEWVVEFHPAKADYVNNMPNCLHLWKPLHEIQPIPPSYLTGVKDGKSIKETVRDANAEMFKHQRIKEAVDAYLATGKTISDLIEHLKDGEKNVSD